VHAPQLPGEVVYHLFLSHVWGTGQDQMRIVKQRLCEMVPDMRVFLECARGCDRTRDCCEARWCSGSVFEVCSQC
jgi:hypothetical protein